MENIVEFNPKIIEEAEEFPIDIFPRVIQNYLLSEAKSIDVPIDFLGVSMLVGASQLMGKKHSIHIKGTYTERAILWACIVGGKGTGKSPAIKSAIFPILKKEKEHFKEYQLQAVEYQEQLEQYESSLKKSKKDQSPEIGKPTEPMRKRYYTTDVTIEKLADLLEGNDLLIYKDELSGWIKGFDKYKNKGDELEQWLSLWAKGNINYDRKDRSIFVDEPFVSVVGGTQPNTLRLLMEDRKTIGNIDNGFIDRMLFCYPKSWKMKENRYETPEEYIQSYEQFFNELEYIDCDTGENITRYSKEAEDFYYNIFVEKHILEQEEEQFDEDHLEGVWSKFSRYTHRLALLIHLIRRASGEQEEKGIVSFESLYRAYQMINYFKSHAKKVLSLTITEGMEQTYNEVALKIKEKFNGKAHVSELKRYIRAVKKNPQILEEMAQHRYGYFIEEKASNHKTAILFTLYTDNDLSL